MYGASEVAVGRSKCMAKCACIVGAFLVGATAWMHRESIRGRLETLAYHVYAYQNVRLIDALPNGSLVFRTGLPLEDPWFSSLVFNEKKLRAVLRHAVENTDLHAGLMKGANVSWTMDSWPLVDVSLLSHETDVLEAEKAFFASRGGQNEFIHYPTVGVRAVNFNRVCPEEECATMQPRDLISSERNRLAASFPAWDVDHSVTRIKDFISMVSTGPPRLYFFHCVCGCDRTGAFFIEYTLTRDPTRSFHAVLLESISIIGRTLFYHYQVAAQWYCEHLVSIGVYKGNDCGDCDDNLIRCRDTGMPFDRKIITFFSLLLAAVLLPIGACLWCCRRTPRTSLEEHLLS